MAELEKVRNPRDLLQRFMSVGHLPVKLEAAEAREDLITEELELTLGLSSNGRFGVDPMRAKKIKRTSSIPEFVMTTKQARDEDDVSYLATTTVMRCATTTSLMRSCSLPTETEEEWRKRKELQTLRRMEARRKRSEKQRNSKAAVVRERNRASSEDNNGEEDKRQEGNLNEISSLRKTTSLTRDCLSGLNLNSGLPPTPSSQGIGSSPISESESQLPPQDLGGREKSRREMMMKNSLEEMPCVSTKGEGPNGKRIQGFLYGYKQKGEEVRIVCVCHGTFLTPAEFVKHAGGNDVAHPLKHILVTPSFF